MVSFSSLPASPLYLSLPSTCPSPLPASPLPLPYPLPVPPFYLPLPSLYPPLYLPLPSTCLSPLPASPLYLPLPSTCSSPLPSPPIYLPLPCSSVRLMSLVFDMIGQSHIFLLQSVQAGTMELLAYLLSLLSWQHLSLELVSCLFTFAKSLLAAPSGIRLFSQVVEHLLFNPSLWVKADKNVRTCVWAGKQPCGPSLLSLLNEVVIPSQQACAREL